MLLAKKYFLSFLFILSFGVLQFSTPLALKPALADETLYNSQSLLREATVNNYGNKPKDVKLIILNLIKLVLSFLAILMVALLIYAGFQYMTSGGNEAKTKEAMGRIQALIVGLLIILVSWGITVYLIKWLNCVTTYDGVTCVSIW
jgi:hypothetical protein